MATRGDRYLMGRGAAPSNRLISQHYLWKSELGWNLHPISQPPLLLLLTANRRRCYRKWNLDPRRSAQPPTRSQACAFDISSAQFPSQDTVPDNVTFQILDMKGAIPPVFQNRFDVVHIRLVIAGVVGNDPSPILRNLLSMLKPGGMLQWGEVGPIMNTLSAPSAHPRPSAALKIVTAISQRLNFGPARDLPMTEHWIYHLKKSFEDEGLQGVEGVEVGTARKEMWKFWCDNCCGAMEELVAGSGGIGAEFLEELTEERESGAYWWFELRVVVGRKPL